MNRSTLAKARRLHGWLRQHARESLPHPERDLLLPCQARQSIQIPIVKSAWSKRIDLMTIVFWRPVSPPSAISQPFNTHRASIVGRFSPIHF
jgi:hypothetical protein